MTSVAPPAALDLSALAQKAQPLSGRAWLTDFARLVQDLPTLADRATSALAVAWSARAEWRDAVPVAAALPGAHARSAEAAPQLWLHLQAQADVPQVCQRCLSPYPQPVEVDRWFRFVADEATALAEDDASEEDVLVLEPRFNLHQLLEDELLLALPLVPMHDVCPEPVRMSAGDLDDAGADASTAERPNPFAALAAPKGQAKST